MKIKAYFSLFFLFFIACRGSEVLEIDPFKGDAKYLGKIKTLSTKDEATAAIITQSFEYDYSTGNLLGYTKASDAGLIIEKCGMNKDKAGRLVSDTLSLYVNGKLNEQSIRSYQYENDQLSQVIEHKKLPQEYTLAYKYIYDETKKLSAIQLSRTFFNAPQVIGKAQYVWLNNNVSQFTDNISLGVLEEYLMQYATDKNYMKEFYAKEMPGLQFSPDFLNANLPVAKVSKYKNEKFKFENTLSTDGKPEKQLIYKIVNDPWALQQTVSWTYWEKES